MKCEKESGASEIEGLVKSLELVSARMMETVIANSQLASAQTPEMRRLFDAWLECISGEIVRFFERESEASLDDISDATGMRRDSVLALLTSLDRMGKIRIKSVTGSPGDGKNRDICDCVSR